MKKKATNGKKLQGVKLQGVKLQGVKFFTPRLPEADDKIKNSVKKTKKKSAAFFFSLFFIFPGELGVFSCFLK